MQSNIIHYHVQAKDMFKFDRPIIMYAAATASASASASAATRTTCDLIVPRHPHRHQYGRERNAHATDRPTDCLPTDCIQFDEKKIQDMLFWGFPVGARPPWMDAI
jgi:hypothetical protein